MLTQLKELFTMDGVVDKKTKIIAQIFGWILLLFVWWLLPTMGWINERILPSPIDIFLSYGEMITNPAYNLIYNTGYSVGVNFLGYGAAVLISIPIGFLIGLIPAARCFFSKQTDALRYVPLPITTGIFVAMFGIMMGVKVAFLAVGITVYLIPVVVQRIEEIDRIHKQTILTLGAKKWQQIRHLYIPSVLSRVSDDIRVLVAISWTYIVVAELINNQGGLGGLSYYCAKWGYSQMVYAIILEIIIFGYFQDKLFKAIDKKIFKFKYV